MPRIQKCLSRSKLCISEQRNISDYIYVHVDVLALSSLNVYINTYTILMQWEEVITYAKRENY